MLSEIWTIWLTSMFVFRRTWLLVKGSYRPDCACSACSSTSHWLCLWTRCGSLLCLNLLFGNWGEWQYQGYRIVWGPDEYISGCHRLHCYYHSISSSNSGLESGVLCPPLHWKNALLNSTWPGHQLYCSPFQLFYLGLFGENQRLWDQSLPDSDKTKLSVWTCMKLPRPCHAGRPFRNGPTVHISIFSSAPIGSSCGTAASVSDEQETHNPHTQLETELRIWGVRKTMKRKVTTFRKYVYHPYT